MKCPRMTPSRVRIEIHATAVLMAILEVVICHQELTRGVLPQDAAQCLGT